MPKAVSRFAGGGAQTRRKQAAVGDVRNGIKKSDATTELEKQAASAAADALLAARKLEVPTEYDSVWLDYESASALSRAGRPDMVNTLLGFVVQPKDLYYEEQLRAATWLSNPPDFSYEGKEICTGRMRIDSPESYPVDLLEIGLDGWAVVAVEILPDQQTGRTWVRASSHNAFEKVSLKLVRQMKPRFCEAQTDGVTAFALVPVSWSTVDDDASKAKQRDEIDPVYDFKSLKVYRDIAGPRECSSKLTSFY